MTRGSFVRRATQGLLLMAGVALAGCGSDSTTGTQSEVGTYNIVSVNGQSLPFTITGTLRGTVVISGGSISLARTGTNSQYGAVVTGTAGGVGPQQLIADAGSYSLSGGTITFTSSLGVGVQYVGAVSGNDISIALPGALFGTTGTMTLLVRKS
jgi:hypothetical protein